YEVKSWKYTRTASYGGSKENQKTLAISKLQVDATRKKVSLDISGVPTGNVIYIRLVGLKSATGGAAWSTETWYTLNAFGSETTDLARSRGGSGPGSADFARDT